MKDILTAVTLIISISAFSQNQCNCKEALNGVSEKIERNSASYAHQVIEYKRTSEYKKHKSRVEQIAKQVTTEKECLGVISFYLSFLRDGHQKLYVKTDMYYPFASFNDTINVKKFVSENVENFKLKKVKTKGLLGDWYYKNGAFALQIQKNKQKTRRYIGILKEAVRSNNQFYGNEGDLKIEFYRNNKNEMYAIYWSFGQSPSCYKVEYNDDALHLGRSLTFYRDSLKIKNNQEFKLSETTFFEELSPKTNYLRINTFDYEKINTIDSVLKHNQDKLASKPNLIIDIRNNGGGSDLSYQALLEYVMDKKKYQSPIAASSIWVSKDNFKNYDDERYVYGIKDKQDSLNADRKIKELRTHMGTFEPYKRRMSSIDSIYEYPKKVFIIQNRLNASSAESFILAANQSKKVTTFGENTGGLLSYGEWRELNIPNLPAWISMTQKKMIFYNNSDYEMIGITPDFELNSDIQKNWVDIVKREIEK